MKIGVYYLASNNVFGDTLNQENVVLIHDWFQKAHLEEDIVEVKDLKNYDLSFVFVGGGGTEGRFLKVIDELPRPIFLLTTGANNSLAASMEILSYLRQNNIPSEIIHGSDEYIINKIVSLQKIFHAKKKLSHFKVGRVGKPSDWLISSDVDALVSKEKNGIEIVDIDMQEFFDEINKHQYKENEYTLKLKSFPYSDNEKEKALEIYGALRRIVDKYELNGVTVRCFDLLTPVKSTGCVALSILNAEGIYASCEGDVPALLSMALLGELTGEPCFQANPSSIDVKKNEIIFAHCTLPMNMFHECELMSHYESGLGVAFRAKIQEGPITVFKTNGYLNEYFVSDGECVENLKDPSLCRTQVRLVLKENVDYFLKRSIGNHHIIIKNNYKELIDDFYKFI